MIGPQAHRFGDVSVIQLRSLGSIAIRNSAMNPIFDNSLRNNLVDGCLSGCS